MSNKAVEFKNVRYCYGDVCAVHNADFSIQKGGLTTLAGPNGGGKSTVIKLLGGFLNPDAGSVAVVDDAAIGYVAQGIGFDDSFPITVRGIVLTGILESRIVPFKRYSSYQREKADAAIEMVGLAGFGNRGVNQLSGGQLKRVVIARALASDADILVLDEPDSNLDAVAIKELYQLFSKLKKTKTIIVASHNIDTILGISDAAIYINKTTRSFASPVELKEKLKESMII